MPSIPWYLAVFISIPQTFLMIQLGFRLFNLIPGISSTLIVSVTVAIFSYLVRGTSVPFHVNTLVIFSFMVVSMSWLEKVHIKYVLLCIILGYVSYAVLEQLSIIIAIKGFHYTLYQILDQPMLQLMFFCPIALFLFAILAIIIKKKIFLYDFQR